MAKKKSAKKALNKGKFSSLFRNKWVLLGLGLLLAAGAVWGYKSFAATDAAVWSGPKPGPRASKAIKYYKTWNTFGTGHGRAITWKPTIKYINGGTADDVARCNNPSKYVNNWVDAKEKTDSQYYAQRRYAWKWQRTSDATDDCYKYIEYRYKTRRASTKAWKLGTPSSSTKDRITLGYTVTGACKSVTGGYLAINGIKWRIANGASKSGKHTFGAGEVRSGGAKNTANISVTCEMDSGVPTTKTSSFKVYTKKK